MTTIFSELITERPTQTFYDLHILGQVVPFELILVLLGLLAIPTLLYAAMAARASKRQTELSTVPMLIFSYHIEDRKMHLKNLNKKFACNLKIERYFVRNVQDYTVYTVDFCLPDSKTYTDGDQDDIPLEARIKKEGVLENDLESDIFSHSLGSESKTTAAVTFTDSQGLRYFTLVRFDNGVQRIVKPPTRLTLFWRLFLIVRKANDFFAVMCWLIWRKLRVVIRIFLPSSSN